MATTSKAKSSSRKSTSSKAADTRARVRDMTVRALRDRDISGADITGLVHDALHGVSKTIDDSVPAARESALRGVFGGLRDAFDAIASAGSNTAASAKRRGKDIASHAVPTAKKHIRSANDELLNAISSFAKKTSSELGDELSSLVKRARRTGKEVVVSAKRAGAAADGDYLKLTGDAALAGASAARTAAGQLALAASGLLQGLGEVVAPAKSGRTVTKNKKKATKRNTKRKSKHKTTRKANRRA